MDLKQTQVIVIGAGIGGLTAALALRQRGADVTVLEQADAIREIGAGLQISPNGFVVLDALGLGAALQQCAVQAGAVMLKDYRGGDVARLDLQRLKNRNYYFVHRADLIDLLAARVRKAGVKIRLLQKVTQVVPGPRPKVCLANGATSEADLVIGADGLHSVIRGGLNDQIPPVFTGQVAWRAIIPNSQGRGAEVQIHMGPHRHVVSYPLRDSAYLNIVAVQERAAWAAESWSQEDDPSTLQATFADFGPDVQKMLSQIKKVHLWGLFRHPVAPVWTRDGVALMGDAAHPSLPFMAQGANMALEDAWALAACLDGAGARDVGLSAYQDLREDRVRRVVDAAGKNAWKYHLSVPPVRWIAHQVLKLGGRVAPDRMMRQFDWIYNYDMTKEV